MTYLLPADSLYEVLPQDNNIIYVLEPIPTVEIKGEVRDAKTAQPINGATVTVSQKLNGLYDKASTTKTDATGAWSLSVFQAATEITAAAAEHVSKTQSLTVADLTSEESPIVLPAFELKDINGTTITLDLTYTAIEEGSASIYYTDYANVAYEVFNETAQQAVTDFNVQYPQIVLQESLPEGTQLRITAISKNQRFMPVIATTTVDARDCASVTLNIVQLGGISAKFGQTENATVVGILYDAAGVLMNKYEYASAALTISDMQDGDYTLITMAGSQFFNSIYSLEQFAGSGLAEHTDYLKNAVTVKSGQMAIISNPLVPYLDETKLYYTGTNTSFTVNKTQIQAGQYLTLRGQVDFKPEYAAAVSKVKMVFELPENCSFVDNSVMVGKTVSSYTIEGQQLTVPLDNYTEQVRFCIIPTLGGYYTPIASVEFEMGGNVVRQPIGSTLFNVKDLTISVPQTVATANIPISGTAVGKSQVMIYDNGQLIGQTTALANGLWATTCQLINPTNLSTHEIFAKVLTPGNLEMQSETKTVVYDSYAIQVSKVKMYHNNLEQYKVYEMVFDFLNPSTKAQKYTYYIFNREFTFTVEFTNNDPTKISNVWLNVKMGNGTWSKLPATFDAKRKLWVANGEFGNMYDGIVPVNVAVKYSSLSESYLDRTELTEKIVAFDNVKKDGKELADSLQKLYQQFIADSLAALQLKESQEALMAQIEAEMGKEQVDNDKLEELFIQLYAAAGITRTKEDFAVEIPEEADETYINELLAQGDLLLAQPLPESREQEIELLLAQCKLVADAMNEDIDIEASLKTALNDTITYVDSQGVERKFYEYTYSKINIEELNPEDLTTFKVTEGLELLVYSANEGFLFIDQQSKRAWMLESSLPAAARAKLSAEDVAAYLKDAIASVESIIGNLKISVDALMAPAKSSLEALKKQLFDVESMVTEMLANSAANAIKADQLTKQIKALEGNMRSGTDFFRYEDMITQRNSLLSQRETLLKQIEQQTVAVSTLRSQATSLKSKVVAASAVISTLMDVYYIIQDMYHVVDYGYSGVRDIYRWTLFINSILPCPDDQANADKLVSVSKDNRWDVGKKYLAALGIAGLSTGLNMFMTLNPAAKTAKFIIKVAANFVHDFLNNVAKGYFNEGQNLSQRYRILRKADKRKLLCHKDDKDDDDDDPWHESNNNDCIVDIDPSGFVFEGVSSNRVQGATATIYYKETVTDMYGDLHENIVLWDAEEHAQENPLFTDENGMYRWDVPQGLWQVKFEKEGYQTTYSEWLPVPPPQLDVNIPMTQLLQPTVKEGKASSAGVDVTFDKYMNPETLTAENILVTRNGEPVNGEIELLNAEEAGEGNTQIFASKVRFKVGAEAPLLATDLVQLTVRKAVKSYAGVQMQDDYTQQFDVEPQVTSVVADQLVNVAYGGTRTVKVGALPVDASKGKTMTVKTMSGMIATISDETLTLDENGEAELTISGELPGSTVLTFAVDKTDVSGQMTVNVKDPSMLVVVAPKASRISGSELYRGDRIFLTTETENADIYYTLDGNTPLEADKAIKYESTQPIVINDDEVTVKAVSKSRDLTVSPSDVAVFTYTLKKNALNYQMAEGWTWISHNLADPVPVSEFEAGADRLLSQTAEVISDSKFGFVGNLTELLPGQAYKLKAKANAETKMLNGYAFNVGAKTISLAAGWNWLGYPLTQTMTLDEAFDFFEPTEGDIITSQKQSAEYVNGQWKGSLEGLVPGEGYLYKSATDAEVLFNNTIVSNAGSRIGKRNLLMNSPWAYDFHAYADVMPLTAQLYVGDEQAGEGDYLLGAFCGDECRGLGQWVEGRLMMNIVGKTGDDLSFMAYDWQTGRVYNVTQTLSMKADNVGSWFAPFTMTIGGESTAIEKLYSDLTVSPTVARDHITVSAAGRTISHLTLTDASGRVVVSLNDLGKGGVVTTSSLPQGVYIVTMQAEGRTFYKKVLKVSK